MRFAQIQGDLQFFDDVGRWKDGRVIAVSIRRPGFGRRIWRGVLNRLGDCRPHLGGEEKVNEPVGIPRVGSATRDTQTILPQQTALFGDRVVKVFVFRHDLPNIAIPLHDQINFP